MRLPLGVALLTLLVAAPAASASAVSGAGFDEAGDPSVWTYVNPQSPKTYRVCPPSAACTELITTDMVLKPGTTEPGTRFEVSVAGETYVDAVWQGRLINVAPAALVGQPVIGSPVSVQPGSWTGGWAPPRTDGRPVICGTAQGTDCKVLEPGTMLGAEHAGRFLFAMSSGDGWSGELSTFDVKSHFTKAYAGPYGPVVAAVSPPPPPVAVPAPTVKLRERAVRSKGRISVGRITCAAVTCKVAVKVSGGGRKAYNTTFVAKKGVTAITAPVRRGKLTVRVHVDGKLITSGKVTAR
jgi:hypothetical protein